ncbi:hypothetical protein [Roseiconus lacunae]|uniref:Uncharacterized protein n=1 Tax=Roseiconus lacunae TaxID=2605694 RepID=A0ABT7PBJ0_9BACT|nr:hypothetical protein [Roseiconus lacunae]MCD0463085.1 hypothetical protein [Roseiconus lacunae]MDM4013865.1 hypothetical protein [Roseiconus lacunae]WRQ53171.1 hypothetical protein U8335_11725 [Stieleria sp. HD01]
MMNAVCNTEVLESRIASQNENTCEKPQLSDAEIMRRVRDIRSNWSLSERKARREEADRRFQNLVDTLFAEAA